MDRISDLPESLLSHILSRLPTKDAVSTCVLSRTWEMKWNCICSLDFDDKLLYSNQVIDKERFSSFVTKVLNHCENPIFQNFRLILSQKYDPDHIVAWISTALDHGVKSLYLHYDQKEGFELPSSFLECKSLQEVTVIMPCTLKFSQVTSFKNLKSLFIESAKFVNESNLDAFGLSFIFPVLEEFTLVRCTWSNVNAIRIEAPHLSCFHLSSCRYQSVHDQVHNCQIIISGSCLTKFRWKGKFVEGFTLHEPPLIREAVIEYFLYPINFWRARIGVTSLLRQLSALVHLELSVEIIEVLDQARETDSIPMFHQLVCLKLKSRRTGSNGALMGFLRRTPNLQYLNIDISSLSWGNDDLKMIGVPICVVFSLTKVWITDKSGTSVGLKLVKFFLNNAQALQLMHIFAPKCWSISKMLIKLKLLFAHRASSNATIEVE